MYNLYTKYFISYDVVTSCMSIMYLGVSTTHFYHLVLFNVVLGLT